jgi:hypothetical protein
MVLGFARNMDAPRQRCQRYELRKNCSTANILGNKLRFEILSLKSAPHGSLTREWATCEAQAL